MESLKQFLDAGGMAVIGVVVGAGLTYLLGALSRRHAEEREDKTRWYEARLRAYSAVPEVLTKGIATAVRQPKTETVDTSLMQIAGAIGTIRFVGSKEVVDVSDRLFAEFAYLLMSQANGQGKPSFKTIEPLVTEFRAAARKDLGLP
jgi:hypothetical protein